MLVPLSMHKKAMWLDLPFFSVVVDLVHKACLLWGATGTCEATSCCKVFNLFKSIYVGSLCLVGLNLYRTCFVFAFTLGV